MEASSFLLASHEFSRYGIVVSLIHVPIAFEFFSPNLSSKIYCVYAIALVFALQVARTRALYERSARVLIFLLSLGVIALGVCLWAVITTIDFHESPLYAVSAGKLICALPMSVRE
ncbi:hypothetical protein QCA50_013733 [Cerrena zonata]|uniref:Uncharacterized protein n=1 Tax=Cerrena zonata TaxID=2478898 RepID=A0AAW0FQM3_9APHY